MQERYEEIVTLRSADCDMLGTWRPGAVLECMQETAGTHSALLGLDRKTMDEMGICWVLSRLKVQFDRVPHVYERVHVETYPLPQRHLFFPRVHIFRDDAGHMIGSASALWMLMDIESRRVTANETVSEKLPRIQGLQNPAGMPGTVCMDEGGTVEGVMIPRFTDLDLNRHVNNTKYLNWCQDALGMACMEEYEICAFTVNYEAEILPHMQVQTRLLHEGEAFAFAGADGEKSLFVLEGTLKKRMQ